MVAEESSEEEEEADDADDAAEKVDRHNVLYHRSANTALQSDDSDEGSDDEEAKRAKEERRKKRAEKKAAKKAAKKEKKLAKKIAKQVREEEVDDDDDNDNGTDGMGQAKKKTVVEDGDKVRVMSSHLAELTLLCRRAVTERERRTMHLKKKKVMMTRKPRLRSALKSIRTAMTRLSRPRLKRFGECG